MEERSTAALQYGGHVAICRHLLPVTAGSDFVLYLDSLREKKTCCAYHNCSRAQQVMRIMADDNFA
jgi:hypothetical protein